MRRGIQDLDGANLLTNLEYRFPLPVLSRWKLSSGVPAASARMALMTSPWLTAAQTAPGPWRWVTSSSPCA